MDRRGGNGGGIWISRQDAKTQSREAGVDGGRYRGQVTGDRLPVARRPYWVNWAGELAAFGAGAQTWSRPDGALGVSVDAFPRLRPWAVELGRFAAGGGAAGRG